MSDPAPVLPPDVDPTTTDVRWTDTGRPYVRTSDDRFAALPDYPWSPNYAEVDGMRMHYVEAGNPDGELVLCLHGNPNWSYLYRKMIPVLAAAGRRVIAPDLIGFGRSDKPVQLDDYTYLQHVAWIEGFIDALDLKDITVVVGDWGAALGLRVVGNQPECFARIVVTNGNLPMLPEGFRPLPEPDSLNAVDVGFPFARSASGDDSVLDPGGMAVFQKWARYSLLDPNFRPSLVMDNAAEVELSAAELAAYDAPFPTRAHMSGLRVMPMVMNTIGEAPTNEAARAVLDAFERPVLGMFGLKDEMFASEPVRNATRRQITGAQGQPHRDFPEAGHYIQEDVGTELADDIDAWMRAAPVSDGDNSG